MAVLIPQDSMEDRRFETSKTFEGPAGNNYARLTALRETERAEAIRNGLIDDPDKPKALEDAQCFVGTCLDMCPLYEREQREFQNDVKRWEINPQTGRIDARLAVKAFHRPAAGNEQALPSDVRPPKILSQTLDYLIDKIVSPSDPMDKDTHGFVRDRTRSIRQDFTLQNERGAEAIQCHERIVRFHILSLHHMCEVDGFDAHQELEQLRKALQSLAEYYDDQRAVAGVYPNEAEFRAYHVLTRLRDPDVLRHLQTLPPSLLRTPILVRALTLYKLAQRSNEELGRFKPPNCEGSYNFFSRFFKLVGDLNTSYLMACLCEIHYNDIRKGALKAMRKAYISAVKPPNAIEIQKILACDDMDDVVELCEYYGIAIQEDEDGDLRPILNKSSHFDESRPDRKQRFSRTTVESKRANRSFSHIINQAGATFTASSGSSMSREQEKMQPPKFRHNPSSTVTQAETANSVSSSFKFRTSDNPWSTTTKASESLSVTSRTPPALSPEKDTVDHQIHSALSGQLEVPLQIPPTSQTSKIASLSSPEHMVHTRIHKTANIPSPVVMTPKTDDKAKIARQVDVVAKELCAGLIREEISAIVRVKYADLYRAKQDRRHAWNQMLERWRKICAKREIEHKAIQARMETRRTYDTAFEDLHAQTEIRRNVRKLRPREIALHGASSETLVSANNASQRFWQAIDLTSDWKHVAKSLDTQQEWKLLLCPLEGATASANWLRSKFALQADSRMITTADGLYGIQMASLPESATLIGLGALIVECSGTETDDAAWQRLLCLIQDIAIQSDRRFPVLIFCFEAVADKKKLVERLRLPEILADRKSPVTAYEVVVIEDMEDVHQFEVGVKNMLGSTDSALSALAMERKAIEEQARRREIAKVLANRRNSQEKRAKLKNSFYDLALAKAMSPTNISENLRLSGNRQALTPQLEQLQGTLQRARELLASSPKG